MYTENIYTVSAGFCRIVMFDVQVLPQVPNNNMKNAILTLLHHISGHSVHLFNIICQKITKIIFPCILVSKSIIFYPCCQMITNLFQPIPTIKLFQPIISSHLPVNNNLFFRRVRAKRAVWIAMRWCIYKCLRNKLYASFMAVMSPETYYLYFL